MPDHTAAALEAQPGRCARPLKEHFGDWLMNQAATGSPGMAGAIRRRRCNRTYHRNSCAQTGRLYQSQARETSTSLWTTDKQGHAK